VWSDDRVEQFIGRLLRIGVLTAAAVVLAGAAAFLAHVGHTPADFLIFRDDHTEIGSMQRDRLYVAITALVLALLVSGLVWTHG
jgi:uncharacterized membrane protein